MSLYRAHPDATGWLIGGHEVGLVDGKTSISSWYVAHIKRAGAVTWSWSGLGKDKTIGWLAGFAPHGSAMRLVGTLRQGKNFHVRVGRLQLATNAKSGSVAASVVDMRTLPTYEAGDDHATDVGTFTDGSIAVVGTSIIKSKRHGLFKRVAASGQVIANEHIDVGSTRTDFERMVLAPNARSWVSAQVWDKPGHRYPAMLRLSPAGKVELISKAVTTNGVLRGLRIANGQVTAIGGLGDGTSGGGLVVRMSLEGKLIWTRKLAGKLGFFDLLATPSGFMAVGESTNLGNDADVVVVGLDDRGNNHWQRATFGGGPDRLNAVVSAGDGGALVVGNRSVNVNGSQHTHGWVARVDAWGHSACSASWKCHGKKVALCDDDKDCTADDCNPITGACQHKAVDNFACDGNGCAAIRACKQGSCQPVGKTRLWFKTVKGYTSSTATVHLRRLTGLIPAKDGGVFVTGDAVLSSSKGGNRGFVTRYDRHGAMKWYLSEGKSVVAGMEAGNDTLFFARKETGVTMVRKGTGAHAGVQYINTSCRAIQVSKNEGCETTAVGMSSWPDGRVVAVLREVRKVSPVLTGMLIWRGTTTKASSLRTFASPQAVDDWPVGVAATGINDVTVVGKRLVGSHQIALAIGIDGQGKQRYRRALGDKGAVLESAVQHPNGGTLAVGSLGEKAGSRPAWLVHLDLLGRTRFSRTLGTASIVGGHAIGVRPDGMIAAVVPDQKGATLRSVMVGLSTSGAVSWTRELAQVYYPAAGMLRGDKDGWWIGLQRADNRSAVQRTDPWGRKQCNDAGACFDDKPKDCDDKDACTVDLCDAKKGCDKGKQSCNDGNPCTKDACDAKTGCVHIASVGPCDDGDVCTTASACKDGVCAGTKPKECDDGNGCTVNLCDPAVGCLYPNRLKDAPCKTASACAPRGKCDAGSCITQKSGRLYKRYPWVVQTIRDLAPAGDGAVVSWEAAGHSDKAGHVSRIDDHGGNIWATKAQPYERQLASAANKDGSHHLYVARGKKHSQSANEVVALRQSNGATKQLFEAGANTSCTNTRFAPWHIAPMADGTLALFRLESRETTNDPTPNKSVGYARRHSNGLLVFKQCFTAPSTARRTYTDITGPRGSDFAFGGTEATKDGAKRSVFVTRLHNLGKPLFWSTITAPGARLAAHFWLPDNGHAAIGNRYDKAKKNVPWLLWFDAKGVFKGDVQLTGVPGTVQGATRMSTGHFAITRNVTAGFVNAASLDVVDAKGKHLWSKPLIAGPYLRVHDRGLQWSGRGFHVLGQDTSPNNPRRYFAHISPWGHFTCAAAGKCFDLDGKTWAACVKKCGTKAPTCDPKVGCVCK